MCEYGVYIYLSVYIYYKYAMLGYMITRHVWWGFLRGSRQLGRNKQRE